MTEPTLIYRVHAVQRMFERRISSKSVSAAITSGEIVEDYTAEMPEPARLMLGRQGKRGFHVVASESSEQNRLMVITVYIPEPDKWNKDLKGAQVKSVKKSGAVFNCEPFVAGVTE